MKRPGKCSTHLPGRNPLARPCFYWTGTLSGNYTIGIILSTDMRHLATITTFFTIWLTVPCAWAQDRPAKVQRALDAVAERKAACLDRYAGASVGPFALEDICTYIAWQPLAERWPKMATKGLQAEARANRLVGQMTECRHQVDRCQARGEQLSEKVGQMHERPTRLEAAAWGVGSGVVMLGVGVVLGVMVGR